MNADAILRAWDEFLGARPSWFDAFEKLRRRHGLNFDVVRRGIAEQWHEDFPTRPPTAAELAYILGEKSIWVRRIYPHVERFARRFA